ncbi:hypothetical protein DY052_06350 [Apilactobacillus timberlakei]|uniref:hypothetical protein n=1 Tax=Apilactobacillus timberlakei TaxID=2008380 RepID=UPI0011266B6F|nr:hypothetical protein [Apilactobacillus timberlakei]TPR15045.1 hypothetical protein DY052_06350 [Apilactobacillus timberlakei]
MKIEPNILKKAVMVAIDDDGKKSLASIKVIAYNYLAVLDNRNIDIQQTKYMDIFYQTMDFFKKNHRLIDAKALCNPNYPDILRLDLFNSHPHISNHHIYNLDKLAQNIDYHPYTYQEILNLFNNSKKSVA